MKKFRLTTSQCFLFIPQIVAYRQISVREYDVVSFYLRTPGECDLVSLEKAFNRMVEENDALRLRVKPTLRGFRQSFQEYRYRTLPVVHVADREGFEKFVEEKTSFGVPFVGETLIKGVLVDIGGREAALMLRANHFIVDGFTVGLIFRELTRLYKIYRAGEQPADRRLYSYKKYMELDDEYRGSEESRKDRAYWKYLHHHQRNFRSPMSHGRCGDGDTKVRHINVKGEAHQKLSELCVREMLSPVFFMMAVGGLTAYARSGKDNFLMQSASHGRSSFALRQTMGCIFNVFPMFFDISPDEKIIDFLRRQRGEYLDMMSHGRTMMWRHLLYGARNFFRKGYLNDWEILFSGMNIDFGDAPEFEYRLLPHRYLVHQFYCLVSAEKDSLSMITIYQKHYINDRDMDQLQNTYCRVLQYVLNHPESTVGELRGLASREEKQEEFPDISGE